MKTEKEIKEAISGLLTSYVNANGWKNRKLKAKKGQWIDALEWVLNDERVE